MMNLWLCLGSCGQPARPQANDQVERKSHASAPTTPPARRRIGPAHSDEEDPDARGDVDGDAYVIRIVAADDEAAKAGDNVTTGPSRCRSRRAAHPPPDSQDGWLVMTDRT